MAVYTAALDAQLFEKNTKSTLALVFTRCAEHMDGVLKALVH